MLKNRGLTVLFKQISLRSHYDQIPKNLFAQYFGLPTQEVKVVVGEEV